VKINHEQILEALKWAEQNADNAELVGQVMAKARERRGLSHREALLLLTADSCEILTLAGEIKQEFYGNRVVLFAPLYLSNYCTNTCVYCPFNHANSEMPRRKLTQDEIRREVTALQDMGHKRLAIEAGEHPEHNSIDYVLESIETIYGIKHNNGSIRRVNVNIAATSVEDYANLKAAQIGTYLLFQETYHRETYERLHPRVDGGAGMKSDYDYHLTAMDRAVQGGIEDIGIGVLFGLYDYRYEFAAMLVHAEHLENTYGVGPHTISVPRVKSAAFGHGISDDVFIRIVAALRIAAPYTGIIISTREDEDCRCKALKAGASQISGGSKTDVGGYAKARAAPQDGLCSSEGVLDGGYAKARAAPQDAPDGRQFAISDERSLEQIVAWLMQSGQIPSFCTACYREGRVGEHFMELAKSGKIRSRCHPNALITLQEYLCDYASPDTRVLGERLIADEIGKLESIDGGRIRDFVREKLTAIKEGNRDFRV
jgi:2-iminoacetate synthase